MKSAAAAGMDGVGDAVDTVDGDDRVGGLRRDGCAGGAHRDAEVGEREGGGVVDAVADHDDRLQSRIGAQAAHHCEFVLG